MYVTSGPNVSVVDGASNEVVGQIRNGGEDIAYDGTNGDLYVTNYDNDSVTVINGSLNQVVTQIPAGRGPRGLAFDSANNEIVVANFDSNNVTVISTTTDKDVGFITVGGAPEGVAYDAANGEVYVTDCMCIPPYGEGPGSDYGTVSVINGSSGHVLKSLPAGFGPSHLALDTANGLLYVTNYYSANVTVINTTSDTIAGSASAGNYPWGLTFDPTNGYIYVADGGLYGEASISIINGASMGYIGGVSAKGTLNEVAFDSANGDLYVTSTPTPSFGPVPGSLLVFSPSGPIPPLSSVQVTPSSADVAGGTTQMFIATLVCEGGPCRSALPGTNYQFVPYNWSLTSNLGIVQGGWFNGIANFTAGSSPGNVTLFVNATFNGLTKTARVNITVTPAPLGLSSTEVYAIEGGTVVVLFAVVFVFFVVRNKRRKRSKTKPEAPSSPSKDEENKDPLANGKEP
jgi:YVTN family beta-propeller protein